MALWTPTQKVTAKKTKEEGCLAIYHVEVPAARVQDALHEAMMRLQLRARVDGFRQGKAPLDVVRRQFGPRAEAEAVERAIESAVPEVLKELGLRPVVSPEVSSVSWKASEPLRFELHVETAPALEAKGYGGLKLKAKSYPATEEDLQARLAQLQESNARLERSSSESVASSHYVVLDYQLHKGEKPLQGGSGSQELLDMSSEQNLAGLAEGLLGAKRQETREFDVRRGTEALRCKATVQEIKEKILPGLDDEFAKDMGFETLDALKAKIRDILGAEGERRAERELVAQIEEALLKANPVPVPPTLVEHQLEQMLERLTRGFAGKRSLPDSELDKLRRELRPRAENEVRLSFLLTAVSRQEKQEITDADVQAELDAHLEKSKDEEEKRSWREFFEKRRDNVEAALRERKAIELIRSRAQIA